MGLGVFTLIALLAPGTLIEAPGVELVRGHCTGCHSERLVTQNRGTRDDWLRTIRWMQRTQNLWPIEAKSEAKILDYLATNYPPGRASRRPPLHPSLMPLKAVVAQVTEPSHEGLRADASTVAIPNDTINSGCACDSEGTPSNPSSWALLGLLCVAYYVPLRRRLIGAQREL
jgi:MYXO-CTERM domain-containing protein